MYYRVGEYRPQMMGALGDVERGNPLPPGHYWIDVFGDNRDKMVAWTQANQASVQVESTTDDKGESWYVTQAITDLLDWSTSEDPATASVRYTFHTTAPVPWDGATFGFPNIIVDPAPGTSPAPSTPGKSPAPGAKPSAAKPAAPSPGMSATTVAIAAGVVLVGAVAFAVMHRRKAA